MELDRVEEAIPAHNALLPFNGSAARPRGAFDLESWRPRPYSQQARVRSRQNGGSDRFVCPRDAHPVALFDFIVKRPLFQHRRVQTLGKRIRQVRRFQEQWLATSHTQPNNALHRTIGHEFESHREIGRRLHRGELQDS